MDINDDRQKTRVHINKGAKGTVISSRLYATNDAVEWNRIVPLI